MDAWRERKWSHKNVDLWFTEREFSKRSLQEDTFAAFLLKALPKPNCDMTENRSIIYRESGDVVGHRTRQFRAFTAFMFPPLEIRDRAIQSVYPDTFYGDILPQFRVQGRGNSISYKCVPCALVEKHNWKPPKLEGLKQLFEHAKSKLHASSCETLREITHRPVTKAQRMESKTEKSCQPKQKSINDYYGGRAGGMYTRCYHVNDIELVDAFKDDQYIHRISNEKKWAIDESLQCQQHPECKDFQVWKTKHPDLFKILNSNVVDTATYVSLNIYHEETHKFIKMAIKSKLPPCEMTANALGVNKFICPPCQSQYMYLADKLKKRKRAALTCVKSRLYCRGMKEENLTKVEKAEKDADRTYKLKALEREVAKLTKTIRHSENNWTHILHTSILRQDEQQFLSDCCRLFQKGASDKHPVQITVMKNLVQKLKSGNNTRFPDLIKEIALMHKTQLGDTNYAVMSDIVGFPSRTTLDTYCRQSTNEFTLGFNEAYLDMAAKEYGTDLVYEASDEARVKRSVEARIDADGNVQLLGESWKADPKSWPEAKFIPRQNTELDDRDDFDALERYIDGTLKEFRLSTHVSVHNFSCSTALGKRHIFFCIY